MGDMFNLNLTASTPPLKWAGGKRWLVPYLRTLWQPHSHRRLVEPFCGGLAVALGLQPQNALLNDINDHLINFYSWLKKGLTPTIHFHNGVNNKVYYYECRDRFNELIKNEVGKHSQESAELFYYLNRTGFNGLCRFNKSGGFNVPFGSHKTINYLTDFSGYSRTFTKWEFTNCDFEQLTLCPDDFVYADPPYFEVDFVNYSKQGFNLLDQQHLGRWLRFHEGPTVISNQYSDAAKVLYRKYGFKVEVLEAPRRISSDGDRTPAREILATRNL